MTIKKARSSKMPRAEKLNFETASMSREDVAVWLYKEISKRRTVKNKAKKFASNKKFSSIYTEDYLEGIMLETIAKVVNAFTAFIRREKGQKIDPSLPEISKKLSLKTKGYLIGYLHQSFTFNVRKDYKKHTATKRSYQENVSIDSGLNSGGNEANEPNNFFFNKVSADSMNSVINISNYQNSMNKIISYLEEYDEAFNQKLFQANPNAEKKDISQLSTLFKYVIDPDILGKYGKMKDLIPEWTAYLYKINKNKMLDIIKNDFEEELTSLYDYIDETSSNELATQTPKKKETYFDQSCTVHDVFEMKPYKGNKMKLIYIAYMFRLNNGRKEMLEETKPLSITCLHEDIESTKESLKLKFQPRLNKLKEAAAKRKSESYKNLYKY